jgi:signal peptidase I
MTLRGLLSTHGSVERPTTKRRLWVVAAVLNLVGPGSGYLYVGHPERAAVAAGSVVLFNVVMWTGLGGRLAEPWVILIPFGVDFLLSVGFVIDAARIAVRSSDYQLRWYNRGWTYISVIIAIIAFASLDEIAATGIKRSVGVFSVVDAGMAPTLRIGERAIADVRAFDAREPRQGEIVVFMLPRDPSTMWARRVIGLPGDRIQMTGGRLLINGQPVQRERMAGAVGINDPGRAARVERWRETLPNGVSYEADDLVNDPSGNSAVYDVPAGHYFVMGDARDDTVDSRDPSRVGYVPHANIVGRVAWIFWSHDLSRIGARAN